MSLTRPIGQKSTFSEHCHVAYQIKGNHECSNMETNILLADTPPPKVNLGGLEKWDLCFVIYEFSKITLCPGYKFDIFALFDFCLARQHILISEFLCE